VYDPLESWNRRVYHFNYRFDQWVFLPVVDGYRYVTPSFLRTGVSNFFNNLGDVPNLLNSLLQLKGHRSLETTGRLLLNTTIGVAGLWDPATAMGLPRQSGRLRPRPWASTALPGGAYLVLPILGPSNLRDTSGLVVDYSAESQINFLNVSEVSSNHPEIWGPARGRQALPDQLPLRSVELAVRVRKGALHSIRNRASCRLPNKRGAR